MTKRDAWRTLQTSILTRHEVDKTCSGSEMGCQSKHMLHRDKAPGKDKGARRRHEGKGVMQGMISMTNGQTGMQTDRQTEEEE